MAGVWNTVGVLLLGGAGWLVTSFLGRPFRQFFDLRGEVIHRSIVYGNVRAVRTEFPDGSVKAVDDLSDDEIKRLHEAINVFRDLAARMRAFALNEDLAVWVVKGCYDPWEANEALFRVSNTLDTYGGERATAQEKLEAALKFRTTERQKGFGCLRGAWVRSRGKLNKFLKLGPVLS